MNENVTKSMAPQPSFTGNNFLTYPHSTICKWRTLIPSPTVSLLRSMHRSWRLFTKKLKNPSAHVSYLPFSPVTESIQQSDVIYRTKLLVSFLLPSIQILLSLSIWTAILTNPSLFVSQYTIRGLTSTF